LQNKWIKKVLEEAEQGCHICLVGTKLDLVQAGMASRAVAKEVGGR
jgi:GTPase SAR1 family protein